MSIVYKNRRVANTTTTGTGDYFLDGVSINGYSLISSLPASSTFYYSVTDGTNWETGEGTFNGSPQTLTRDIIIASSNANSAVNWGAGDKTVALTIPANKISTGWQLVATGSASGVSSVEIAGLDSTYSAYKVLFSNLISSSNNVSLAMRMGTSYGYSAGGHYIIRGGGYTNFSAGSTNWNSFENGNSFILHTNLGTAASRVAQFEISLAHHASTTVPTTVMWRAGVYENNSRFYTNIGYGQYFGGATGSPYTGGAGIGSPLSFGSPNYVVNDRFEFLFSSGTISSVDYVVYGIK